MAIERTFSIIKPDGVEKGIIGRVVSRFETNGLKPIAMKMKLLSRSEAEGFYAVHKARPFYGDLVRFMTSGPIVPAVLEGENAIARWRELMGPTDAGKAPKGTVRGDLGADVERNAVHGSDAPETARVEIAYFFNAAEIAGPVEALA